MGLTHKARAVVQYIIPTAAIYMSLSSFIILGKIPDDKEIISKLGGIAVAALAATLIQDIIPKPFKEILVFWRLRDRLPGHRAFSGAFSKNSRIDFKKIKNLSEISSLLPGDQQRIFYRIYKNHSKDVRVEHYSCRYICWRDTASVIFMLTMIIFPTVIWLFGFSFLRQSIEITTISAVAFLMTSIAARQMAIELVYQVLVIETIGKSHVIAQ